MMNYSAQSIHVSQVLGVPLTQKDGTPLRVRVTGIIPPRWKDFVAAYEGRAKWNDVVENK